MPTLTLTPDLAKAIANAVAQGVPIETAAEAAGIDKTTPIRWLQLAETGHWHNGHNATPAAKRAAADFSILITRARAEWTAKQVANIAQAATERNAKGQLEWRASAWLLNNHPDTRRTFHEERTTTVDQTITVHQAHTQVKELDTQALLALRDGSENTQFSEP